jgi:Tfp pilus assembly protein PilV
MRRRPRIAARPRSSGIGLFDALVALAILAFGLLALSRLQGRMVAQTTEVQARTLAAQLADELLANALVDVGNANCYTLPAVGGCANAAARAATDGWAARVPATLPGTVTQVATLDAGRLTVVLTWTGKESQEQRRLEASTDVRP